MLRGCLCPWERPDSSTLAAACLAAVVYRQLLSTALLIPPAVLPVCNATVVDLLSLSTASLTQPCCCIGVAALCALVHLFLCVAALCAAGPSRLSILLKHLADKSPYPCCCTVCACPCRLRQGSWCATPPVRRCCGATPLSWQQCCGQHTRWAWPCAQRHSQQPRCGVLGSATRGCKGVSSRKQWELGVSWLGCLAHDGLQASTAQQWRWLCREVEHAAALM
jgi:hypothetical protein